jgi:very-short-patch-repair endonuclease
VDNDILMCLSFISGITKTDISASAFRKRYKQRLIESYNQNPNKCIICGNIVPYDRKNTYTCCKKCCHIKANKERGPRSAETKEKISAGVIRNLIENGLTNNTTKIPTKFKLLSECISLGILENYNNVDYVDRYINPNSCKEHICPICGKVYHTYLANNGELTNYSACSKECLNIKMKRAVSNKVQERIKNGIHKGWQSRNITSYPERFWKQVLENNNISYKFNYHFDKYFLDFYIEIDNRKIDLEIDGKQHKYQERLESDRIRDEFVKSQNIEVYRIDWNEINSDEGKNTMKNKIDKFLSFIQHD